MATISEKREAAFEMLTTVDKVVTLFKKSSMEDIELMVSNVNLALEQIKEDRQSTVQEVIDLMKAKGVDVSEILNVVNKKGASALSGKGTAKKVEHLFINPEGKVEITLQSEGGAIGTKSEFAKYVIKENEERKLNAQEPISKKDLKFSTEAMNKAVELNTMPWKFSEELKKEFALYEFADLEPSAPVAAPEVTNEPVTEPAKKTGDEEQDPDYLADLESRIETVEDEEEPEPQQKKTRGRKK